MRVSYQQEAGTPFLHVHAKQPLCLELGIWNQHATQPSLSTSPSLFTFSDLSHFSSGFSDTVKLILNFSRCSRFRKSNIIPAVLNNCDISRPSRYCKAEVSWYPASLPPQGSTGQCRLDCCFPIGCSSSFVYSARSVPSYSGR